ncbi:DUF1015 family protein [Pedobacter agri]|uniref:DUF1015 family protein n=1 Tax=Pedobacter agri TaxID=454586 RepID=UPI002930DF8A|nr:DUF1015 family protein [Pedobacter agri]
MARIKEFVSLLPDQAWFSDLLENAGLGHAELKHKLEGRGEGGMGTGEIELVDDELHLLVKAQKYVDQQAGAIYIYEQQSISGSQFGIWAMADVQDFVEGQIVRHEDTLKERAARLTEYRCCIGLEGAPVLLTYPSHGKINDFISRITRGEAIATYRQGEKLHRLWKVEHHTDLNEIKNLFLEIPKVYVGDGHHRLAAARNLHSIENQRIMALYVSTNDIKIAAFTRLVNLKPNFDAKAFIEQLKKIFVISSVPSNKKYVPDRIHRFGMCLNDDWYQLDLKHDLQEMMQLADVNILQQYVLAPLLEIHSPESDPRLICDPLEAIDKTLERSAAPNGRILFTVFRLSVFKLIEQADAGMTFPPKSSFIEPKVPYALILNAASMMKRNHKK